MKKRKQTKPSKPTKTSRAARNRSRQAVRLMRQKQMSLSAAAKQAGTTPKTIIRYARDQLSKGSSGRYAARATGHMVRHLWFLTLEGKTVLEVRSPKTASLIAKYWAAVHRYNNTGEIDRLQRFRGKSIRVGGKSYGFVMDLKTLRRLAAVGEFEFEDLYADVA
jgi:hypothetical protein